jgi:uncharacterized protein (TIGR02246 family)
MLQKIAELALTESKSRKTKKEDAEEGPMRRTSILVTVAFLAGLAVGVFARGTGLGMLLRKDPRAADVAAIKKLEQEDIEVTVSQDPKGLLDVWAEDGVRIGAGRPPTVGKQAIAAENEMFHAQHPEFKVLKYAPSLAELCMADGWAIEVGNADAAYRMSAKSEPVSVNEKGTVRVLKRQSDGSWKFAVVGLKN